MMMAMSGAPAIIPARSAATSTKGRGPRERGEIDGLHEVMVEAGFAREAAVLVLAPSGDGDEHGIARPRFAAQAPRGIVAVQARHADVEEDDLRLEFLRFGKTRDAVERGAHLVA